MTEKKVLTLLGFASKAKKLVYGKDNIREYIKDFKQKHKVIIIASDAGERVKRDVKIRCEISRVPYIEFSKKDELSKATGMLNVSVLGIKDENIVKSIIDLIT
ncbi:L7Ae/L30e/S12e/Gadd45 family ribosomal protein [Thermosipho atlanticus]|uniref:LSU ribosomal protein L7AE n=1 Tax=Thermosipho atlanticus DSM 15807 TaxID=1123380 RepID=A0A1M5QNT5_9BACT|nr:ribosomal L7Ae/L30e/S12e/Gadd45 family protein [Thermosipho atlanticus]SHH15410.1 LSU ribosomal protein L7AE [Thermosipho atlanticus DSM 15807]